MKDERAARRDPGIRRSALAVILAGATVLSGCAEDDEILPGKREDVRSVLSTEAALADEAVAENTERPIVFGAQTTNADWPQSIGTPAFRTAHPALSATPRLIWSVDIGDGDSRRQRITADPVVAAGVIYTLDSGATVTATTQQGARLWQRTIDTPRADPGQFTGGGLAIKDGRLFVSLGLGELVALEAGSGNEAWRQRLGGVGAGTPTAFGDLVYVTGGDDTAWALSAETGRIVWQISATPDVNNVLGAPAPALSEDLAVFAFGSGEIQAAFRQGGLRRWDASVLGERPGAALSNVGDVTGAPVIAGQTVYAGNQSGRTVALALGSGSRLWTADDGAVGPILPVGDSVFFVSDRAQLVRLDAGDGSRVWAVDLPRFVKERPRRRSEVVAHHGPVLAGGRIYVASNDGLLRSFDPVNGALLATIETPGGATADPAVAGATLYVVSTDGELHAFR